MKIIPSMKIKCCKECPYCHFRRESGTYVCIKINRVIISITGINSSCDLEDIKYKKSKKKVKKI